MILMLTALSWLQQIKSTQESKQIETKENQKDEEAVVKEETQQHIQQEKTDSSDTKFDEIRKYKKLLDEGVISEEDFEKAKNKIFGL